GLRAARAAGARAAPAGAVRPDRTRRVGERLTRRHRRLEPADRGEPTGMPGDLELAAHIAVAALLGALLGLEREWRGQVAGMRTHALVAMGAAIFTIAGAYGFEALDRGPNGDPMRVAAQVASGIGFIGAGAILREGAA